MNKDELLLVRFKKITNVVKSNNHVENDYILKER